ncbi:acylphosphatase [Geobacter pickeringii]|uniref:Acylphosphatase n=1 Tax=Geobacter pickeringii TaxID=345632 RepID=A0A0B5BFG3_9BACT|nr:acylphosphatase [Geobacter pickeringii]AJE03859.1 acylphosphatase [Geobacter pickeringii]
MKIRAIVTVSGLVQGVAFRHHTVLRAQQLKVAGWVRNLPNGDVQGCFEGDEPSVQALVEWCRLGPSRARVDRVIVENEPYRGEFDGFDVRY